VDFNLKGEIMDIKSLSIICFTVFACIFLLTDCTKHKYNVLGTDEGTVKIKAQIKLLQMQLDEEDR